jgi:DNA-binding transcriptional ArsR family regulator
MMPEHLEPSLTEGQYKLVAHPLRIRILHALRSGELTAAQVADHLGESRGNVHYHIQKLNAGGLVEVTRTAPNGGIVERYYRAATARFRRPQQPDEPREVRAVETWLERTATEVDLLLETFEALLGVWERVGSAEPEQADTWKVLVRFERVASADDDDEAGGAPPGAGS